MKRDVQVISWNEEEEIVISVDNSGGIGGKEADFVHVPYEQVAYYAFRVAMMENLAAEAVPFSIILQNFCGEKAWDELVSGIKKGINELALNQEISITGSTETNFTINQSAVGLTVLGKRRKDNRELKRNNAKYAVIGSPLVGEEVLREEEKMVPLSVFLQLLNEKKYRIQPIGSKGILYELGILMEKEVNKVVQCSLDVYKSSGPSTCFLLEYEASEEERVKAYAEGYFHELFI